MLTKLKALASAERLAILELLDTRPNIGPGVVMFADNARNVTQIAAHIQLSQSATSQHLAILRKAEFVNANHVGNAVFYSLAYPRLFDQIKAALS